MKYPWFLMFNVSLLMLDSAGATSFGRRELGVVTSIDNRPSICLPEYAEKSFLVGWVSLTESYRRNPSYWGASLLPGFKPVELKPGACMVFGEVPEGYELDNKKTNTPLLVLEVNKTYVFSLVNAYRPVDSYDAVFCISKTAEGEDEYLQYIQRADGVEVIPSCGLTRRASGQLD